MKKIIFTIFALVYFASTGYSQVTTLWEKSAATGTKPVWDSGSLTRGLSYGLVGGNNLLFVVARNAAIGGKQIIYFNALTGDSLGQLNNTGIAGGVAIVNDAEVSTDGKIFVCNMTTNASADAFKVYRYDSLSAAPVAVITYNATADRLGDKFTVTGSTADNSIVIWVATSLASAGPGNLLKFTTTDNGQTFTSTTIPIAQTASSASVGPFPDASFYHNSHGTSPTKYASDGTAGGSIPTTVIATSGSAIRYLNTILGDDYIVANDLLVASNNARIIKVTGGVPASATLFGSTPLLGSTSAGGLGDVSVQKVSDFIYNVYVLASNNGFGAYQIDLRTPMAGNYYVGADGTGPGGSNPDFPSLRTAFQEINNANITGDCTFYITSDVCSSDLPGGLGLAVNPGSHTITFKPYTGVQPVITLPYTSDSNSGPSGAMIIGIPMENNIAWNDLRVTRNIIFDGSNTVDGTTRDLTITNQTNSVGNAFPVTIVGDVSNVVIKNCNIFYKAASTSTSNLFRAAVQLQGRLQNALNWTPTNITIENNHISTNFAGVSQGMQGIVTVSLSPTPTTYMSGIVIKDNLIEGTQRAVALGWSGSTDVYNNGIVLNQAISATTANQAIVAANLVAGSTVNIYDNRITSVSSISNGATAGNTAISIESGGTYTVYNNMISGFNLTAANPTASLRGISVTSADATANIYYNTIYMDNISDIGTGVVAFNGIYLSNGTNDVKNNIVVSAETDFVTYGINKTGTTGTLASNYNDFYPVSGLNGNVGFWNASATQTLVDWQTASGQDANSVSKEVFFVSATDLHLTGASNGDEDLVATPIAGITTDIDGETRSALFPYKGADEGSIPLPVELVSFSASVVGGNVILNWSTATEINNRGFEIQRKSDSDFETLGFVDGNGTTTKTQSYTFKDDQVGNGTFSYRLKQMDYDGSFSYSNVISVDVNIPAQFELSQNYPNPFNPTTMINYQIAEPVNVTLSVFNMLGEEVAVLINNQFTAAGQYSVRFDGSNLASGTYIYRLTAGDFVQTKKIFLTK